MLRFFPKTAHWKYLRSLKNDWFLGPAPEDYDVITLRCNMGFGIFKGVSFLKVTSPACREQRCVTVIRAPGQCQVHQIESPTAPWSLARAPDINQRAIFSCRWRGRTGHLSPVSVPTLVTHMESNYSQLVVSSESYDGQSRTWGCCESRGWRAPVSEDVAYLSLLPSAPRVTGNRG